MRLLPVPKSFNSIGSPNCYRIFLVIDLIKQIKIKEKTSAKYIAFPASLPIGLNKSIIGSDLAPGAQLTMINQSINQSIFFIIGITKCRPTVYLLVFIIDQSLVLISTVMLIVFYRRSGIHTTVHHDAL